MHLRLGFQMDIRAVTPMTHSITAGGVISHFIINHNKWYVTYRAKVHTSSHQTVFPIVGTWTVTLVEHFPRLGNSLPDRCLSALLRED